MQQLIIMNHYALKNKITKIVHTKKRMCMQGGYVHARRVCACKEGMGMQGGYVHARRVCACKEGMSMQGGYVHARRVWACKEGMCILPHKHNVPSLM